MYEYFTYVPVCHLLLQLDVGRSFRPLVLAPLPHARPVHGEPCMILYLLVQTHTRRTTAGIRGYSIHVGLDRGYWINVRLEHVRYFIGGQNKQYY